MSVLIVGVAFGVVLVEVTVVDDWCGEEDVVEDGSGEEDKVAVINNNVYVKSSVQ